MGRRVLMVFEKKLNRLGYRTVEQDRWGVIKGSVLIYPKTGQPIFSRKQLNEVLKLADSCAVNIRAGKLWASKGRNKRRRNDR